MTKYVIRRNDGARTSDEYDYATEAAIALIEWCFATNHKVSDYEIELVSVP